MNINEEKESMVFITIKNDFVHIYIFDNIIFFNKDVKEISKYWTLVVIVCNFITIFALYKFCKKNNITYLKLIDYKKSKIKNIIIIGLLITLIGIIGSYLSGFIFYKTIPYTPDIMIQPLPLIIVIIDLILLPITSTFAEEGIYLGVGINKLKLLYPTIFFYLLQHCFFPMILDIKYIVYRFVAFIPAIIFMCLYYKKKKEITPIMFGHFVINFVTILQYLVIKIKRAFNDI